MGEVWHVFTCPCSSNPYFTVVGGANATCEMCNGCGVTQVPQSAMRPVVVVEYYGDTGEEDKEEHGNAVLLLPGGGR